MRTIPIPSPVQLIGLEKTVNLPPEWALSEPTSRIGRLNFVATSLAGTAIVQTSTAPIVQTLTLENRGYWWVPYSVISDIIDVSNTSAVITLKYHADNYDVVLNPNAISFTRLQKSWPIVSTDTITDVSIQFTQV